MTDSDPSVENELTEAVKDTEAAIVIAYDEEAYENDMKGFYRWDPDETGVRDMATMLMVARSILERVEHNAMHELMDDGESEAQGEVEPAPNSPAFQ